MMTEAGPLQAGAKDRRSRLPKAAVKKATSVAMIARQIALMSKGDIRLAQPHFMNDAVPEAFGNQIMWSRFGSACLGLALACQPASAEECLVCDPEVVMTPTLAKCFAERAEATLSDMERNNLPYQLVNLGTCEGIEGDTRGGDETADSLRQIISWSDIRNAREGTPTEATTTFILDREGILCLEAAIRADPEGFNPAAAFRPSEMCAR